MYGDFYFILYLFLISIIINLLFFIIAYIVKTDVFTDLTYSVTFIVLVTVTLIWKQQFSIIQIIIYLLVIIWALRIGTYLLIRILKTKVDHRFDKIRNSLLKFLGFWFLQGLSVFLISLPATFALSINKNYFNDNNFFTYIFIIFALFALIFEAVADKQKYQFYQNKVNQKSLFMKNGLWKISRHPNYFGEIMFWWFLSIIFIFNLILTNYKDNYDIWYYLLILLSPLYITILLLFISGVPILEVNSYYKFKDQNEYKEYINKTSIIIPWIGKKRHILKVKKIIKKEK